MPKHLMLLLLFFSYPRRETSELIIETSSPHIALNNNNIYHDAATG